MSKPTKRPSWMTGLSGLTIVEPTGGEKAAGWAADQRPPAEYMNWIFQNISDWIDYINTNAALIELSSTLYKAIVGTVAAGSPATHASLAAALADSAVVAGSRILILEDQTQAAQVVVSKANIELVFASRKSFIKSAGTSCLRISADGFKIWGGRFSGWSTAGDKAIIIDSGIKNVMIRDVVFASCDTQIDDSGTNTSQFGCIVEE